MPDAATAAGLTYRAARPGDVPAIAWLHADSWRRHYRGAFSDAFLDDEAATFLGDMWPAASPPPTRPPAPFSRNATRR